MWKLFTMGLMILQTSLCMAYDATETASTPANNNENIEFFQIDRRTVRILVGREFYIDLPSSVYYQEDSCWSNGEEFFIVVSDIQHLPRGTTRSRDEDNWHYAFKRSASWRGNVPFYYSKTAIGSKIFTPDGEYGVRIYDSTGRNYVYVYVGMKYKSNQYTTSKIRIGRLSTRYEETLEVFPMASRPSRH